MKKIALVLLAAILGVGMSTSRNGNVDGTFTDPRDGKTYKYVQIGNQIWMAENLRFDTKRDSMFYDNESVMGDKYGRLYRWNAARDACPDGWHLPTDEEWKELEMYLGMADEDTDKEGKRESGDVGKILKSTSGWTEYDGTGNGTDEKGFSALPAGLRWLVGTFSGAGEYTYFWSATPKWGGMYYYRYLSANHDGVNRNVDRGAYYMSVRCIKDSELE